MNAPMPNPRVVLVALIGFELRKFLADPTRLLFLPLLAAALPLALSPVGPGPLVLAGVWTIIVLERSIAGAFDRTPGDYRKLRLLGVSWRTMLVAHGIGVLVLVLLLSLAASLVLCACVPYPPGAGAMARSVVALLGVAIPAMAAGIAYSLSFTTAQTRNNAFFRIAWCFLSTTIVGIPVFVLAAMQAPTWFLASYDVLVFFLWHRVAIPAALRRLDRWTHAPEYFA